MKRSTGERAFLEHKPDTTHARLYTELGDLKRSLNAMRSDVLGMLGQLEREGHLGNSPGFWWKELEQKREQLMHLSRRAMAELSSLTMISKSQPTED